MVSSDEVKLWDTFTFKILPLIILIPLTLRVLEQTQDIPFIGQLLYDALRAMSIESFLYGVIIFAVALTSVFEMSFARNNADSFWRSLNAGAFIMLASAVLGIILGIFVFATGYPSTNIIANSPDQLRELTAFLFELVPYYMVFGIIVLVAGAREEIANGARLGLRIGN